MSGYDCSGKVVLREGCKAEYNYKETVVYDPLKRGNGTTSDAHAGVVRIEFRGQVFIGEYGVPGVMVISTTKGEEAILYSKATRRMDLSNSTGEGYQADIELTVRRR